MAGSAPHQSPLGPLGASARARCARRVGVGGARGARRPPTPMRIPRRARSCRVRRSLHPCALLAVRHGVALKPPTPRHVWYEHEAHAERVRATRTARGCRPRPRRSHAGHGTTGSICSVPPHGAPGRVHQTPPCALGCAFEREARAERAQNHRAARGAHPRPRGTRDRHPGAPRAREGVE